MTSSPFVGLNPFSVEQADYFFGRDQDAELLVANVRSSRLTLLYGPSGVGKTSLLTAGVIARLETAARDNITRRGKPGLLPVLFRTWQIDPIVGIAEATRQAAASIFDTMPKPLQDATDFTSVLRGWTGTRLGDLLLMLDQFELFFVYANDPQTHPFVSALAECVADASLSVNVVISVREDWLPALDVFKGRMPGLFDNYLRLRKLDRDAARLAVQGPIVRYNKQHATSILIETGLVDAVLSLSSEAPPAAAVPVPARHQRMLAWLRPTSGRRAANPSPLGTAFEGPALQIIMQRLWDEEVAKGTRILRRTTLDQLTGERDIIDDYVRTALKRLRRGERRIVARLVERLVTPSGTKIAMRLGDLAAFAYRPTRTLEAVVAKLGPLLNDVAPPRGVKDRCFEISHDVLAPALSRWQGDYRQRQRMIKVICAFGIVAASAFGFGLFVTRTNAQLSRIVEQLEKEQRAHAEADAARQRLEEQIAVLVRGAADTTPQRPPVASVGAAPGAPTRTDGPLDVARPVSPVRSLGPLSRSSLWKPGTTLHVRFLDGAPALRTQVERAATEWTKYANLNFDFDDAADAQIRISFKEDDSWAFQGNQALAVPPDEPTVNLGFVRVDSSDLEVSQYVLHEFGHVLGLVHEMNQPNAQIPWNVAKVIATFTGPPNNWSRQQVDLSLLGRYAQGDFPSKPFDPASVMMFPIPRDLTDGRFETGTNSVLSPGDKGFVAVLYPGRPRS